MPTKKTTKKTTAKPVIKKTVRAQAAPVQNEHVCACGHDCPCHRCGKFKKLVVLIIVFCLGFAAAKFSCGPCKHHMKHMPKMHPVFVNGCLDMESIKCPKMQAALQNADVSGDGCISAEEFKAAKKSMPRPEPKHMEQNPENM